MVGAGGSYVAGVVGESGAARFGKPLANCGLASVDLDDMSGAGIDEVDQTHIGKLELAAVDDEHHGGPAQGEVTG